MTSDLEALLARATALEEKAEGLVLEATGQQPAAATVPEGFVEALEQKLDLIEDHLEVLAASTPPGVDPVADAEAAGVELGVEEEPLAGTGFEDPEDPEAKSFEACVCGATERDEFKDGTAACSECGAWLTEVDGELKAYDFDGLDALLEDPPPAAEEPKGDPEEPKGDPDPLEVKAPVTDPAADDAWTDLLERRKALDPAPAEA